MSHETHFNLPPQAFPGRAPDQVAYVVRDLEESLEQYARLTGVADWKIWDYHGDYLPNRTFRGQPSTYRSLVAIPSYGPQLEIIQPLEGPSVFTEHLEARGPGLHHLGFFVPSLEDVRTWFRAQGVEEVMSGGGQGVDGDGEFAYFDTSATFGSYLEFIEPPARRYGPHFERHYEL